jgi:hypothetical protein
MKEAEENIVEISDFEPHVVEKFLRFAALLAFGFEDVGKRKK